MCKKIKLNLKYVSEYLKDIEFINKGATVFIEAQTGTGKTTAILGSNGIDGLIDKMGDKKLIYLVNRLELKREIKLHLCNKFGITNHLDDNGVVNLKVLDGINEFKNVTIMSYQQLDKEINNREKKLRLLSDKNKDLFIEALDRVFTLEYYDYIVCDEIHYLFADANFNDKTVSAYNELVRTFYGNSIKIFMTATADDVKEAIRGEITKQCNGLNLKLEDYYKEYSTNTDYSYLNIKYYYSKKDIITTIKNSKNDGTKWMFFMNNISLIKELVNQLVESGINAKYLTANEGDEVKQQIRDTNQFDCKVLFATSALDCGVNIKDDKVVNVVIDSMVKTAFIQELGRVRININNAPIINLYIPTKSPKAFRSRLKNVNENINQIKLFENDSIYFDDIDSRNLCKAFKHKGKELYINQIVYQSYKNDRKFLVDILERIEKDKFAFIKEQLGWLKLESTFDENNLIEDVLDKSGADTLEGYLEDCVANGTEFLTKEDREPLIKKIGLVDEHNSSFKKGKITYVKNIETLNSHLTSLGLNYQIVQLPRGTTRNKKGYRAIWIVKKLY